MSQDDAPNPPPDPPGGSEEPEEPFRDRYADIATRNLGPGSLMGSYCIAIDGDNEVTMLGCIVAEVQPPMSPDPVYLFQLFDGITEDGLGTPTKQVPISLARMLGKESSERDRMGLAGDVQWSFYDTLEAVRAAWIAHCQDTARQRA